MEDNKSKFTYGKVLKKIRYDLKMSTRDFAEKVGISYGYVAKLEKETSYPGRLIPTIDILYQICDKTHYPFRQFLEEAGYIDPVPAPEPSPLQQIYDKLDANSKDILMHTAELLLNQMGEVTQFPDNDKIIDNIGKIN